MKMNLECKDIIKPDLCIFLDVDIDLCESRIKENRFDREIYENIDSQRRIRKRFFEVFDRLMESENIKIVDAGRTIPEVSADIIKIYKELKEN